MAADGGTLIGTEWRNWSGNQTSAPRLFAQPRDEAELRTVILEGPGPVRAVGSGHSFTALAPTEGTIVNLDRMGGVKAVDRAAETARVGAGARLYDLSPALEAEGLAFKNLGDINRQSIAGAAGTATHGTGARFPCLAAEIQSARLMTASGEILEASRQTDPDLLMALQVSLGALGVITEVELSLRPVFNLRRRSWAEPLSTVLDRAEERWASLRNYEFFYIPFSGCAVNLSHEETETAPTERPPSADEEAVQSLRKARDLLSWSRWLRRRALSSAMRRFPEENAVGSSWRLLASERRTLFNEMEYHLPPETALDALREVVARVEKKHRSVCFPIEVRRTAGDDAWLSPFQGGPRTSVAVHSLAEEDHAWFFEDAEPIFRAAGGRPHWGKLHALTAADLGALYPDFERFRALREKLDPAGRFLNPHLAALFDASSAG